MSREWSKKSWRKYSMALNSKEGLPTALQDFRLSVDQCAFHFGTHWTREFPGYPTAVPPLCVGCMGQWLCGFSFLAFKLRELYSRAVLKELHLRSLLHTWIWFVWWDSGLWGHLIKGWEFLGPWERVGVFACERNMNLGARTWAMLPQDGLW